MKLASHTLFVGAGLMQIWLQVSKMPNIGTRALMATGSFGLPVFLPILLGFIMVGLGGCGLLRDFSKK
jgi:hypothetical protein